MTARPTFKLTAKEGKLLAGIAFDGDLSGDTGKATRLAGGQLAKSLLARGAIPRARLSYFIDPQCNPGRRISRREQFERNGTRGTAIFVHPHFLKYLLYFLFGPTLPPETVAAFAGRVQKESFISGSDVTKLCAIVRQQTLQHGLVPGEAAEEFFKLALECDLDSAIARQCRDAAKKIRR